MSKQKVTKKSSSLGRATWKGSLKLSKDTMIQIPVKAFTSRLSPPSLKTTHKVCGNPIKTETVCPKDGKVEKADTGKAHEYHKDHFVQFTTDEIDSLKETRDSVLEITGYTDFVNLFPSMTKDKTYYLLPESAGAHEAYQVFLRALELTDTMAVGVVCLTSRSPAAIYAEEGILKLTLLEYSENIKPAEGYASELIEVSPSAAIVKEMRALVNRNKLKRFSWEMFEDQKTRELLAMIDKKIRAGKTSTPETGVIDLKAALKKKGKAKHA